MGQASRTTKLLDRARAFYVAFFLAHPDKLAERVPYFSEKHQEERERLLSPNELLTWAESLTVATTAHPHPLSFYNFSEQFPEFPFIYRRSVIKDALGKARSYLSNLANWNASGAKKGQPGPPSARNHPTLYDEACCLDLDGTDLHPRKQTCFARLKVYTGTEWQWHHYPVKLSRYFEARWRDPAWESLSPKLILRKKSVALHFPQVKQVAAKKVKESKEDPHLVTVAVDLNVKKLAVRFIVKGIGNQGRNPRLKLREWQCGKVAHSLFPADRSERRSLWRDTPMKQARPVPKGTRESGTASCWSKGETFQTTSSQGHDLIR